MESSLLYSNNFFTSSTGISKRGLQRGRLTAKIPDDFDYELTIEVVSFTFQIEISSRKLKAINSMNCLQLLKHSQRS